jgi:hypothetical protein
MPKRLNIPIKLGLLSVTCLLCLLWNNPVYPSPYSSSLDKRQFGIKTLDHEFITNGFSATGAGKGQAAELHIEPALKQGLNLILPTTVQRNLNFDAGYDRWEGVPTVSLDYFLPIKGWNDKSLFFTPRISMTGIRESFSMGAGVRQMLTAETMVGFYAFNDWIRPRRLKGEFLKEAGVGVELSTLPGHFSDLTISMNAYLPINERRILKNEGNLLVREMLPAGGDARIDFLLPALTKHLDIRLDGEVHSYRSETTNLTGYRAGLNVRTRDGMLNGRVEASKDSRFGENYRVEGNISLAFDWVDLLNGRNPFSPPYRAFDTRFSRNVRDSLYGRVTRKHDLPMDKTESKTTLMAEVTDNTVYLSGGFPHLSNSWVTVQTSQSPWEDSMDIMTDSSGAYAGRLDLAPGIYRVRLVHKPTGRVSNVKTIVVEEKKSE